MHLHVWHQVAWHEILTLCWPALSGRVGLAYADVEARRVAARSVAKLGDDNAALCFTMY